MMMTDLFPGDMVAFEDNVVFLWPNPGPYKQRDEYPVGDSVSGRLAVVLALDDNNDSTSLSLFVLCDGRLGWYCGPMSQMKVVSR